jgi:hypothetical protein
MYNTYKTIKLDYLEVKNIQDAIITQHTGGNRSINDNIDRFSTIINTEFQKIFQSKNDPEYHMFFDSFDWWLKTLDKWSNPEDINTFIDSIDPKKDKYGYDPTEITKITDNNDCKYIPNKTLTSDKLKQIYNLTINNEITNFATIRQELDIMFDYNMPSTLSKKQLYDYLDKIKTSESNVVNIVVVGAGPVGLYTALYLDHYYNKSPNIFNKYVNILLLDNRIYEEEIKLPYSRLTQFGFDINDMQMFIKNISCWNIIKTDRHFDFINTLENLLYLVAYERNIPMYFTKKYETYDKVKKLAQKYNFHYIMDCTGGRLGAKLDGDIVWNKFKFIKNNYEVKYVGDNKYRFFVDGKEYFHTTVVLQLLDENKRQFSIGNVFGFITNNHDDTIINKYTDKCFEINDYVKISRRLYKNVTIDNNSFLFSIFYYLFIPFIFSTYIFTTDSNSFVISSLFSFFIISITPPEYSFIIFSTNS